MRILIFGLPRCGTTTLFDFLMEQLPKTYTFKYEPYKTEIFFIEKDLLVKTVLSNKEILIHGETLKEHSERIVKEYDKVIYLVRQNINDIKSSFYKMKQKNFIEKYEMGILPKKEDTDYQINEWLEIFYLIANKNKIYYYEEIFTETPSEKFYDLLNYLNLNYNQKLFEKYIHPKNKNKVIKKQNTLI